MVDFRELLRLKWSCLSRSRLRRGANAAFPLGLGMYLTAAIIVILVLERTVELPMVIIDLYDGSRISADLVHDKEGDS